MAAQTWSEWLAGLVSGPRLPPRPGSHEAFLEELRLSALLDKELRKSVGQRDEELAHKLRVEFLKWGLANAEAALLTCKLYIRDDATDNTTRQCCVAGHWTAQRIAASHRALAEFYEQFVQQKAEDFAAAEARRQPIIAARPTLRLELPEALQQAPPRVDMCSKCAQDVQKMELAEEHCRAIADACRDTFQRRAREQLVQSALGAAASSGAPDAAAAAPAVESPAPAAADPPAGEAQQGQRLPSQQQQQQQQDCDCDGGGAEGAPTTPKQTQQQQQQQQHHSSEEEQH